jgi:hypothetical protein
MKTRELSAYQRAITAKRILGRAARWVSDAAPDRNATKPVADQSLLDYRAPCLPNGALYGDLGSRLPGPPRRGLRHIGITNRGSSRPSGALLQKMFTFCSYRGKGLTAARRLRESFPLFARRVA